MLHATAHKRANRKNDNESECPGEFAVENGRAVGVLWFLCSIFGIWDPYVNTLSHHFFLFRVFLNRQTDCLCLRKALPKPIWPTPEELQNFGPNTPTHRKITCNLLCINFVSELNVNIDFINWNPSPLTFFLMISALSVDVSGQRENASTNGPLTSLLVTVWPKVADVLIPFKVAAETTFILSPGQHEGYPKSSQQGSQKKRNIYIYIYM